MSPQQTIAHYRITAKLGEGGMGEVWRATDTKLNREVAIKVLPEAFAADPDRIARFTREAQVLASLNHPNIAVIYGVEERALVMELVEGPTLAERIAQGAIPWEEALPIGKQIAEALEYAHDRGIVHRDLKPANIKVTPEGRVKVLDFGLAAIAQATTADSANPMSSPTLTMRATQVGVIMGTAAYMSPEQAKGKPVDRRADIWAFGVVLYEMLTGRQMYTGETVSDTLAAVLLKEPELGALPAGTPPAIRRLLRRCLDKDPLRRLRDIGEARVILERAPSEEEPAAAAVAAAPRRGVPTWAAALLALAGLVLAIVHFREPPRPPERSIRFQVPLPPKVIAAAFELSPDGRYLAIASNEGAGSRIWIRPLGALDAHSLAGTEGGVSPFWSPDSASIAFFSGGKLKKVAISGGPPQTISEAPGDAPNLLGGAWGAGGIILLTTREGSVYRVAATGGVPAPVTRASSIERHRTPVFLPDARHFLYTSIIGKAETAGIYGGSLGGAPALRLLPDRSDVKYMSGASGRNGYLIFMREDTLMAQSFDAEHMQLGGEVFPVAQHTLTLNNFRGAFSVSSNGTLAYESSAEPSRSLVWVDRTGKELASFDLPGDYRNFRLSPDEKRVVIDRNVEMNTDIWVVDLARGRNARLTSEPGIDNLPIWSPDGNRVLFPSNRSGAFDLYVKAASGTGQEEVLVKMGTATGWGTDWSRDGKFILYEIPGPNTGEDLWIAPQFGDGKPYPYLQSQFSERSGRFSPDGRWIAYVSDESGRNEVYVQAFPLSGAKHPISIGGGTEPQWRSDGSELFYVAGDCNLMAVPVKLGANFEAGVPTALFPITLGSTAARWNYAVSSDGKRVLMNKASGEMSPITVVLNWAAGLSQSQ